MSKALLGIIILGAVLSIPLTTPILAKNPDLTLCAMQNWKLVVAEDAIPSERYAAEEFRSLYQEVTGQEIGSGTGSIAEGTIFIGPGKEMRVHRLGFDVNELGEEGLRFRLRHDALIIAGGRPRGTLYGVYEFFERNVGVRFLTRDHTYIPKGAGEAPLQMGEYSFIPPFSFRWSYYGENTQDPAFATRLRNNTITSDERLGGRTSHTLISHSVANYVPVSVYGKDHPEYFALVDGVRKLDVKGGGPQLCVTHPDVIEIVSDAVIKELDAHPEMVNVSVSQMDNSEYCHCPRCEVLTEQEGTPMGPHLAFVNAVAEHVEKKHPGVMVGTLAYDYTRKPPKTIRARDNVEIQLCSIECCTVHALNDPSCRQNVPFCKDLEGWKEKCNSIWIWNYNTNFRSYDLPFRNINSIEKNVKFFVDNGVRGVFMQAAGNAVSTELSDLRNYVISRCLWNPLEDNTGLVYEFCTLHYGESANPIIDYLDEFQSGADNKHPGCFPTEGELGIYARKAQRIQGFFNEALNLAKSEEVRARVEKASICALKALIATAPFVCEGDRYKIDTSAIGADTIRRYIELSRRFGLNMVSEEVPAEQYWKELEKLQQGVPAVTLENQVWKVVILPEQNGKLVELTYKKTGRNLVEAPTRSFGRWRSHEEWTQEGSTSQVFTSVETQGQTVRLTRTQPDGTVHQRTISLASDTADKVSFHTEYIAGSPQLGMEFKVHPEYFTANSSEDPNIQSIYVKDPDWIQVNADWNHEEFLLPEKPCPHASGGAFAYYNHDKGYGVIQTFDPAVFQKQVMYWSPGRRQVSLEMFTPTVTLEKGRKLTFGYEVGYLENPPIEIHPEK